MRTSRPLVIAAALAVAPFLLALKYAEPGPKVTLDPSLPAWQPGKHTVEPEEEFNLVGADTMDEITLGWVKHFRQAYPKLSVTMEARASGTGIPALTEGRAHLAPVAREPLPPERDGFVKKFGYEPFAIRVASGAVGSLGKTATSLFFVHKDNPIAKTGLTFAQLDAIYSTTRKRGHADVKTWGDLGLTGEWQDRPIKLYGLRAPNGIEQFLKIEVLQGGAWKPGVMETRSKGPVHAFTVMANEIAAHDKGGIGYGLLDTLTPDVRLVPLARKAGEPFQVPTPATVLTHTYPLSRFIYVYANRKPGQPLDPKVKEFYKLILSRQGQQVIADERVFLPLPPAVLREELKKLE